MTVAQTAKDATDNSITVTISGATEIGDRETKILDWNSDSFISLDSAKSKGYLESYTVSDFNKNNGDITLFFSDSGIAKEIRVWYVQVVVSGDAGSDMVQLPIVLPFAFENTKTKVKGKSIDVTADDMRIITNTAYYINDFLCNAGDIISVTSPGSSAGAGDKIFAYYLQDSAKAFLNASDVFADELGGFAYVVGNVEDVAINCKSGTPCYADYFNRLAQAVNNFMLSNSST